MFCLFLSGSFFLVIIIGGGSLCYFTLLFGQNNVTINFCRVKTSLSAMMDVKCPEQVGLYVHNSTYPQFQQVSVIC